MQTARCSKPYLTWLNKDSVIVFKASTKTDVMQIIRAWKYLNTHCPSTTKRGKKTVAADFSAQTQAETESPPQLHKSRYRIWIQILSLPKPLQIKNELIHLQNGDVQFHSPQIKANKGNKKQTNEKPTKIIFIENEGETKSLITEKNWNNILSNPTSQGYKLHKRHRSTITVFQSQLCLLLKMNRRCHNI